MDEFFGGDSGFLVQVAGNSKGGCDNGQVRFEGVFLVVEYRAGFQVGFEHAEGLFYMP
ncbi:hypothetical protein [uncultured Varibaculum sp.]|uniref:hypothetical protein n=1 Tax=uncultured Varibaculum sp. TaxID=413896 RepID=UPI00258589F1|nr:hypothetical protein [uncultured Varibaculum sp.]